jgi:hypothetical protein
MARVDLKRICESALNLKIVSFFHENPQVLDTAQGLCAWINYDCAKIKKALDFLVSQDILVAHRTGATVAYAYTQQKEIVKQVERFLRR